mgnify:CR=1 FL=1
MKCNVCGGNLISNKDGLLVCEFCGNVYQDQSVSKELESQLRSKSKNESIKMLELAEENRKRGDYDEAYYAYQGYLENNPKDANQRAQVKKWLGKKAKDKQFWFIYNTPQIEVEHRYYEDDSWAGSRRAWR